jgi:hypothetical protein
MFNYKTNYWFYKIFLIYDNVTQNTAYPCLIINDFIILCNCYIIIRISMNSKNNKKIVYNSRKKAIFSERQIPKPSSNKLVWAINFEGSTFMPVEH